MYSALLIFSSYKIHINSSRLKNSKFIGGNLSSSPVSWSNIPQLYVTQVLSVFVHVFTYRKKNKDVKSDSNYGFHFVAKYLGHGGDSHMLIRLALFRELSLHKSDYMSILSFETHFKYIKMVCTLHSQRGDLQRKRNDWRYKIWTILLQLTMIKLWSSWPNFKTAFLTRFFFPLFEVICHIIYLRALE